MAFSLVQWIMICIKLPSTVFFEVCVYLFAADLNRLNEKLSETEKVKMDLQLKLDDLQSSESSAQVWQRFFKNHYKPILFAPCKSVLDSFGRLWVALAVWVILS